MLDGKTVKATIVESVIGVFGFNEKNEIIEKKLFPKDPIETAELLRKLEEGKSLEEMTTLIKELQTKGYTSFVFENQELARSIKEKFGFEVSVEPSSEAGRIFRENSVKFALDLGFFEKPEQFHLQVHKVSIELAKIKVKKSIEKRDLQAAQASLSIDDLDKSLNLFMSRIREWFGLHFPELDRLLEKHETYVRLVVNLGRKENFTIENLENEGIPKNKSESMVKVAEASMGADISDDDLSQIQELSRKVLELYVVRQSLENHVEMTMEEVAPNTKAIAGSLLGARLIAIAGGLVNLAKLPASTMQVLGAEKALFRALKTKARPPKHGIIFQHPLIHDAKRWQRGKIARALAGKLSIAARVDAFNGKYVGDEIKADLEKRVEEIKERYDKCPLVNLKPSKKFTERQHPERKQARRKKRDRKR